MVLNRKQMDEDFDDDFSDFDDKLESISEDQEEEGPSINSQFSWRRTLIIKAAQNVRKAIESKADLNSAYKKGELLFDEQSNKFGRVIESRPGFLNLCLLAGGKIVRQNQNPLDFIKKNRQMMTLPQMAEKLFLSELEIISLLNQIEADTEKAKKLPKLNAAVKPQANTEKKILKVAKTTKLPNSQAKIKPVEKNQKSPQKPDIKIKAKIINKISATPKKAPLKQEKSISFAKLLPKGATTDPVMDPNGYIQQNFLLLNNKELSIATGLSEHTIRRKLGEWGLKRKDFVNKA